jgi:tRNA dimethylallyltransferase
VAAEPAAILLMGPTASGKSALAAALAQRFPVEIVSVDSAQIYRGMDIGTAKPSIAERRAVPHHLIDILDPTERYSAAQFRGEAIRLIREISARGRTPLLVGGTLLYFKALREGLSDLPDSDDEVRAGIDAEAAELGWHALHARLAEVDPQTAARLKPTDSQRIQRALEVWRVAGTPLSQLQGVSAGALPFKVRAFGLVPTDRTSLHKRIEERFDAMLEQGIVEELGKLKAAFRLSPTLPSMRCVGYRQAWDYLEGKTSKATMREQSVAATRQLAKRQLTWLRSFPDLVRLDAGGPKDAAVALDLLLHEIRQRDR